MTTLPLKAVKLLPNMDAMIGGGVRSGMQAGDDCKLSFLVEAQLVRIETKGKVHLLPVAHCGFLEPAPVEPPAPAQVKK
jgi:hypothetical protein